MSGQNWCGALLGAMPNVEIECNLPKGHDGDHQHIFQTLTLPGSLESELSSLRAELEKSQSSRKHTQDWYAAHYGKLHDWARKILPEPYQSQFFCCIANGTWGLDDVGKPYMTSVGRVVPSGYIKFDSAQEPNIARPNIACGNRRIACQRT